MWELTLRQFWDMCKHGWWYVHVCVQGRILWRQMRERYVTFLSLREGNVFSVCLHTGGRWSPLWREPPSPWTETPWTETSGQRPLDRDIPWKETSQRPPWPVQCSGQYASYWNACLFEIYLIRIRRTMAQSC